MLCLAGATLYGLSNVAEEYVIKSYDGVEFLGMIGLFGSLINGIQLWVKLAEKETLYGKEKSLTALKHILDSFNDIYVLWKHLCKSNFVFTEKITIITFWWVKLLQFFKCCGNF